MNSCVTKALAWGLQVSAADWALYLLISASIMGTLSLVSHLDYLSHGRIGVVTTAVQIKF
jgi:hypothetical protein